MQQVLTAFVEQGLLSDERFAEAVVRSRRRRGYGPMRIRRELQEKGLPEEAAARWADTGSGEWLAEVERVRRRKFGPEPPRDLKERARQARFLQGRGFTYEQIRRALNSDAVD